MTDITELAQSLKAAAEKASNGDWVKESGDGWEACCSANDQANGGFIIAHFEGPDAAENREFVQAANPANIIALVEALEKAQQVDEELCRLLPPGAEYMDPPDGGDVTPLEGVRRMVADYRQRIAELESRTVKLPAELYTIGELIRTQDNRITDQPMFVVFQKREIIGSDEHSPSRICWVWDGEEVSELRAKRLEALYQDGRDTRGYDRYAMQEVDEFVTACFTEHGCKDYLRQNGHNLRLPYIYACGSFRNNEYQLVRNWLAGIKVEAE
ncbi:ead/Ea22-like family protein [Klebsiella quasipneumoniae]|uniref:ead/Ea22-like family protein n=1 Tax=Klebsiella quasipneumoniae TaxID=1463165 RepID=UPI0021C3D047|nr:ead/Ea22-like family protein [Klebsiella quasipneumoniae]